MAQTAPDADPFVPAGHAWQGVSPRLSTIRRGLLVAGATPVVVALVLLVLLFQPPGWLSALAAVVLVVALAWGWWLVGRVVATWRYAEAETELYISRGALFRRLVVVPYGRMQYVDVTAGPLDQLAELARLELHTASPGTTATIPGLTAAEAGRLRDRLTASAESSDAGL